jgi:hypothetical protein
MVETVPSPKLQTQYGTVQYHIATGSLSRSRRKKDSVVDRLNLDDKRDRKHRRRYHTKTAGRALQRQA